MDSPYNSNSKSSILTMAERLGASIIPFIALIEALIFAVTDCFNPFPTKHLRRYNNEINRLAKDSRFSVNELEALYDLFRKLSSSIINDDQIQKEELQLALFKTPSGENFFLDRVFYLFDERKIGAIEFEGFVHALSIFHPHAPLEEKIDFAFRLYDLRQTGYIEREEVKKMVIAFLMESDIKPSCELLEAIIDKTFADVDADMDGRISKEEWKIFVLRSPTLLKYMTLPHLMDITTVFPSFIFKTEVGD